MQRVVDLVIAGIALLLTAMLLAGPAMLPQAQSRDDAAPSDAAPGASDEAAPRRGAGDLGSRHIGHGRNRHGPVALTPELIEVCLQVAQDVDEQLAAQLRAMRADDPRAFQRKLGDMHRLIELALLKQRDPDHYSLKRLELAVNAKVNRLSGEYRDAQRLGRADEMTSIERLLRDQVRLQIGFSLRAREDYVCRLEELALGLQGELEDDRNGFDERVEQRLEELTQGPSPAQDAEPAPAVGGEPPLLPRPFIRPVGAIAENVAGDGRTWSGRVERPARPVSIELNGELTEACLEVARDIDAALAAELEELRREHPERLEAKLRQTRRLVALGRLKLRDPVLYSLKKQELDVDAEVSRLAAALRDALAEDGQNAASLQSQLRQYVRLQLAFSLHARQNYVASLEDLIQRLRDELQREQDDFENAVARRIARLLDRPQDEPEPAASDMANGN